MPSSAKPHAATLKIRGGCEVDSHGRKAGKGALIQWEMSGALGVSQDQTLFVWYTNRTDKTADTSPLETSAPQSRRSTELGGAMCR